MFETQKIDTFFSGEKNLLDEEEKFFLTRRMKVVRFLRLFLPCLTALLLGCGVLLFDFSEHNESALSLAEEERIYFEKFRMKNTVFEITEKDSQFSVLKADTVEENEAGKKFYTLTNPDARTNDKGNLMTIKSKMGYYNQTTQQLDLNTDVIATYNKDLEINTNSATYNFSSERGFGNEKIVGTSEKGTFSANKFEFDKKNGMITLIQNVVINSEDRQLTTPKKAYLYFNSNKFVANEATMKQGKDILKGDTLTIFFKDTKKFEIKKALSVGHTEVYSEGKAAFAHRGEYNAESGLFYLYDDVRITDKNGYKATADVGIYDNKNRTFTLEKNVKIIKDSNVVTAPKAIYFENKDEFRFYNGVKVTQEGNSATATTGVYFVKKGIAELEHNVVISKNGNIVRGDKAISDFNTSKSRLIAKDGGRISGKLIEKTFKNN